MEQEHLTPQRAARGDVFTALAGILLVSAILAYQVWDFRAAFTKFDEWWVFFGPSFAGDDYIAVTLDAEQLDKYSGYYRTIAVLTAARRMAGGTFTELRAPERLHLLWGLDPDEPGHLASPVLLDTALNGWGARKIARIEYDPVVSRDVVDGWRREGRVTELAWNVAAVESDSDEQSFVLHTDEDRVVVYVVPASLSSVGGGGE